MTKKKKEKKYLSLAFIDWRCAGIITNSTKTWPDWETTFYALHLENQLKEQSQVINLEEKVHKEK